MMDDTVSLVDHFNARFDEQEKRHTERIQALEKQLTAMQDLANAKQLALALAVEKQEATTSVRLAGMNEWRQTFGDFVSRAVTREVFTSSNTEIDRRLNAMEQWQSRINGQFATWGIALTLLTTVIAILSRFVNLGGS